MNIVDEILTVRHLKRDLYVALLSKGLGSLTETEKQILAQLSIDHDIVLLLSNGHIFELDKKEQ